MADVSGITAVKLTSNTATSTVTYGATVSIGDVLYLDSTDNKYKLADASASATASPSGIAVTAGVDTDLGIIATGGTVTLTGATLAIGEPYVVSATAGGIAPETDLATTEYVSRLGTASTATQLVMSIQATGIQHA